MKPKYSISLFQLILMIMLAGCSDDTTVQEPKGQEIYFEVVYTNSAWGKQFKGLLIDKDGKLHTYDKPAKWNITDGKAGISETQMKENITYTTLSDKTVSRQDLSDNVAKVNAIKGAEFSKPIRVGADMGTTSYYAYQFDANDLIYKPVLLSYTGDTESHNTDSSAIAVSAWLKTVLDLVYK